MKKKRIIPILILREGVLVQSRGFCRYQTIGNPIAAVKRFSEWACDELIYLDISRSGSVGSGREDLKEKSQGSLLEILKAAAHVTFMPLTFGGGIVELSQAQELIRSGADKVAINTSAVEKPKLISEVAKEFGSQSVVISIDVKKTDGEYVVFTNGGKVKTNWSVRDWAIEVEKLGAGEILLKSIERDGSKSGYDLELYGEIAERVSIPVIASGGAGTWEHLAMVLEKTKVDAVAAANIFHHSDQSVFLAREYLYSKGLPVRAPKLFELSKGCL